MTEVESNHAALVARLCKPGEEILRTMTPDKMDLLHVTSKLCSEAGELMDAVGKWCYYNKDLDRDNMIEELGDFEFYVQRVRTLIGVIRAEVLNGNIEKLTKRYGDKYSDKAAQERADKQVERILEDGKGYHIKIIRTEDADLTSHLPYLAYYNYRMGGFEINLDKVTHFVSKEDAEVQWNKPIL